MGNFQDSVKFESHFTLISYFFNYISHYCSLINVKKYIEHSEGKIHCFTQESWL